MSLGDLDFVAAMLSHPEVMRFYLKLYSRQEATSWIERQLDRYERHGHGLWLAEDRATGEPRGQVGLMIQEVDGIEEPEIGYLIHYPFWRQGLATEAALATGREALALTALAGIAVNLVQIALAPLLGAWWRPAAGPRRTWWLAATLLWALANYAEAFSYLVLNSLWLKSDMAGAVAATGISRWIWFTAGILAAGLIARGWLPVVRKTAEALTVSGGSLRFWKGFFLLYTAGVGLAAAVNRAFLG